MKLREPVVPYVVQEVDYVALRQAIEQVFADAYGLNAVRSVRVAHFNPNSVDVTVMVRNRQPEMDDTAMELGESLRRQGLPVAIRVTGVASPRSVVETKVSTRLHHAV
jgi:hypothetical protein